MNASTIVHTYTQGILDSKSAEILFFVLLSTIASILGCRVKKSQCTKSGRGFIFNFQASDECKNEATETETTETSTNI
jgi:hypothetical protein